MPKSPAYGAHPDMQDHILPMVTLKMENYSRTCLGASWQDCQVEELLLKLNFTFTTVTYFAHNY